MPGETYVRESLRELIANDGYAATFQSIGQYRDALLKHIKNREAAELAEQLKTGIGTMMADDSRTALAAA